MCIHNRWIRCAFRFVLCAICVFGLYVHASAASGKIQLIWYFTVLSNVLVFIYFLYLLILDLISGDDYSESMLAKGAVTMCILLAGIVYNLFLSHMTGAGGVPLVGNLYVHILTPCLVFADYFLFTPKGTMRFSYPLLWAILPIIYLAAVFARVALGGASFSSGQRTSYYPYPFLDVNSLGAAQVIGNIVLISVGYIALGYLFVLLDRMLAKIPSSAKDQSLK